MNAAALTAAYGTLPARDLLAAMIGTVFNGRIAVSSSFGAESAVLLDLVAQVDPTVPVIFLDTNELFDETHAYRDDLVRRLGLTNLRIVRPAPEDLRAAEELWRTDTDRCCHLRKVLPFERAVSGFAALVDGRKRAHGFERASLGPFQDDGDRVKISPLWSWSAEDIARAQAERALPAHPLVAQGYRSIGCWPCTRPTAEGEPARAGRWAGSAKTECGLHVRKS
jgi:phosphoadenosine phosphosulfate reductase